MEMYADEYFNKFKKDFTSAIRKEFEAEITALQRANEELQKENKSLKAQNNTLLNRVKESNYSKTISNIINNIKFTSYNNNIKLDSLKNNTFEDRIYQFVSAIYPLDYDENVTDCPLWLKLLTRHYSHKEEIIELLKMFDYNLPDNIESFRLPMDWNEEEMDYFFENVNFNVNVNGLRYNDNLKYCDLVSLSDPIKYIKSSKNYYLNFPWQFILRNPLLRKEKYLKQIGRNICNKVVGQWDAFSEIDKYLDLSDNEIKIILNEIQIPYLNGKYRNVLDFCLRYVNLINDVHFLNVLYDLSVKKYIFPKYLDQFPREYFIKYYHDNLYAYYRDLSERKIKVTHEENEKIIKGFSKLVD